MDYLQEFVDLNEYVKEYGPLKDEQVMQILFQQSHAVAYLHHNKIAH
jgi:hypothetical protein